MNGGLFEDFKNAWGKPNNAVVQIILINVVVFAVLNILKVVFYYGQFPGLYLEYIRPFFTLPSSISSALTKPWTLITYMFSHEGFWHILWNMMMLYWFGRIIQEFLNSKRVISIYVLGGIVGGLSYIFVYNAFPNFEQVVAGSTLIGASAGVVAIVVGAAVFMPNYTFFLMFIGPVKIKYIALVTVFLSLIQSTGSNAGGEIAHLGGALVGWLYITQLNKGTDIGSWIISFIQFVKSMFKPQPKIRVTHRTGNRRPSRKADKKSKMTSEEPAQAEIDEILDKISQSGYESLSKEEKQKLFNASKK
ncbi:MAG: rhomboid family intramembrane serine protease [Bacteroidota bacterium]